MNEKTAAKITVMADSAVKVVEYERKALATRLTAEGFIGLDVVSQGATDIARAQGAAKAWARALNVVEFASQPERDSIETVDADVKETLLQMILQGAGDTWSGRGNDVKRAEFDGLRDAVSRITDMLGQV